MNNKDRFIRTAHKYLMYTLSLPERTIRSLAALAGGTTTLLTEMLFPESLRNTTVYNVSFGMMQRFIVEKVAGIDSSTDENKKELANDYVQRKMAGTALEAAGLLAMRFSPIWVFAIAGDAAGGSKVFLNRLVEHLKDNKIIPLESEATELVDVLEAIQVASSKSATSIDTPPLSRKKLTELADEMKESYTRVFKSTTNLIPRLDTIWENMEQLANREKIPIERLGGIVTLEALSLTKKGAGMVFATGQTGVELFDEKILDSYRQTLRSVSEKGIDKYMSSHMKPFMQSAKAHFNPDKKTWLESKFKKGKGHLGISVD